MPDFDLNSAWLPTRAIRPNRPLGLWQKSGGDPPVTCHSLGERSERQLPHPTNSCSRPWAACRGYGMRTFRNVWIHRRYAA